MPSVEILYTERFVPESKYNEKLVTKFINAVMLGKEEHGRENRLWSFRDHPSEDKR